MLIYKLIIIFNLFLSSSTSSYLLLQERNVDDVVLVNILFRHGDRTPMYHYPNDPYNKISYWPEGLGQLTDVGKRQAFEFGLYLRKRYDHFLPKDYNKKDILVQSTDFDRCLMTAQSVLAAMYPPTNNLISCNLYWQPIPVHTAPTNLLALKKSCSRYDKKFDSLMKSPEIINFNKKHKVLYDYVAFHTGAIIKNPFQLEHIYDTLLIQNLKGFILPNWTNKVFPNPMSEVSEFTLSLEAYTKELQRLKSGPLLNEMVKNMQLKSSKQLKPDRKLFLYSAHDSTIANFLMTLGAFYPHSPPYTAAVFVLLHHKPNNKYFVSVLYRNETSKEPYPLRLSNCPVLCPLDQFIELTKPVRLEENLEAVCS